MEQSAAAAAGGCRHEVCPSPSSLKATTCRAERCPRCRRFVPLDSVDGKRMFPRRRPPPLSPDHCL